MFVGLEKVSFGLLLQKVVTSACFPFRLLGYKPHEDMCSFPSVDADAKIKPDKGKIDESSKIEIKESQDDEESAASESEEEGEGEEDGKKKKRPKEKIGFRDRKVN